jgi:hypothetical protein
VNRYANGGSVEVTFAGNLAQQMDSAIKGEGAATHDIERVVIQGNRIHHPRYCANSWNEGSAFFNSFHPQGAKAVCLFRPGEELPSKGNHVIRYNEFYADREHMFYDILFDSQGSGPMQGTDAQRDMDIYGNLFRDCLDDCMELERGFGNVRVFDNWFDNIFKAETGFISQSGPYYMFRNVFDRVLQPSRDHAPDTRAWTGCAYQSGDKRFYFYHNTLLCPGGEEGAGFCWAYGNDYKEIGAGRGVVDDGNFTISRNNIYQTLRWPDDVNYVTRRIRGGFSFDYELYNGVLDTHSTEAAAMWGPHALRGTPRYREGHGSGHVGRAQLDAGSPGKDAGVRIPNFNDDYEGAAPDIGAHEHGAPDMKLGVRAYRDLYRRGNLPGLLDSVVPAQPRNTASRKTAAALQQAPVDFNHPPRDYARHSLYGWEVLVEQQLAEDAPDLASNALARVETNLGEVAKLLPAAALPDLRKVRVFLMHGPAAKAGGRNNGLEYFRADAPTHHNWLDPRMASSIVIFNADNYARLSEFWALKALVHECGHAQHLEHWPEDRVDIFDTWQSALGKGLYEVVREEDQGTHNPNYPARNHLEYFAELTATYFAGNSYFPRDRAALKAYDPVGFALIETLWGLTPQAARTGEKAPP